MEQGCSFLWGHAVTIPMAEEEAEPSFECFPPTPTAVSFDTVHLS